MLIWQLVSYSIVWKYNPKKTYLCLIPVFLVSKQVSGSLDQLAINPTGFILRGFESSTEWIQNPGKHFAPDWSVTTRETIRAKKEVVLEAVQQCSRRLPVESDDDGQRIQQSPNRITCAKTFPSPNWNLSCLLLRADLHRDEEMTAKPSEANKIRLYLIKMSNPLLLL